MQEGDYVRHRLDTELLLRVIRIENWPFSQVLVVEDVADPRGGTFKVEADQVVVQPPPPLVA
jgi:hypothetical protein